MGSLARLRSSTFQRGALIALIAWAPGAAMLWIADRATHHAQLERGVDALHDVEEEIVSLLRAGGHDEEAEDEGEAADALFESFGPPVALGTRPGEAFSTFLDRYVARTNAALETVAADSPSVSGLRLRLAFLGEAKLPRHPPELLYELVERMSEEIPEDFHDGFFAIAEAEIEEQAEHDEAIVRLRSSELIQLLARPRLLAESEACLRVWEPDSVARLSAPATAPQLYRVGKGETPDLGEPAVFDGDDDARGWCLAREAELADGGRVRVGMRFDDTGMLLQRSRWRRDLLVVSGIPLVLLLGWLFARPVERFLRTVEVTAERQARGQVGTRLRLSEIDRDLATAARAVNHTFDHLERAVQALSQVGDSIAHDLRTPLSRLQGQLDLLRRYPESSPELIDAVQAEADQILETFNALLRIAQVESGQKRQGFRRFDLVQTVADVAELYGPVFAEKNITFIWRRPEGTHPAVGDRELWMQALSTLVENALKYTPAGGRVSLALDVQSINPRLVLRDSGPGIPEVERENVFRRFYRLERHRGERGSGLGLSLVAAVCDLHGAAIVLAGDPGLEVEITF